MYAWGFQVPRESVIISDLNFLWFFLLLLELLLLLLFNLKVKLTRCFSSCHIIITNPSKVSLCLLYYFPQPLLRHSTTSDMFNASFQLQLFTGFLSLPTNDILAGQLFVVWTCPVHYRMFNSIPSFYPLDARSITPRFVIAKMSPSFLWSIDLTHSSLSLGPHSPAPAVMFCASSGW